MVPGIHDPGEVEGGGQCGVCGKTLSTEQKQKTSLDREMRIINVTLSCKDLPDI